ncbi:CAP domain-containing protein NDAI_0G05610 [Naumovozyma dairenensis CBS 421]|uniref:SCP domain-containing protein n=1 Tax=Naumovozyma dairenensis (strain ATCC 10597 / BCRC 20456 / CBS 421 / NBRC 0211 / NRRL Y-12639) TaxID=1071378 RepID=J7REK2_NAUDC|nr:hypothetical protein NDAI_0G05610 [Naumovozyma dairenensis CBS 421]CCK73544.1 hypothetical protein NDAI_0G05610 [Naumovozyma dairenensis CBS 421]
MQFSKLSLVALASTAIAAPAAQPEVTVTAHDHNAAVVTVQGIVFVEGKNTHTTYITLNGLVNYDGNVPVPTSTQAPMPKASLYSQLKVFASKVSQAKASKSKALVDAAAKATKTAVSNEEYFAQHLPSTTVTSTAPIATLHGATTTTTSTTPITTSTQQQPTTTTVEPTTSATASDDNLSDFASSVLSAHNAKRALHKDTPALKWSDNLASYAQAYADAYDCSGNLQHSGGPYGENLALGYSATGAVDAWYGEISDYDWSNPGAGSAGHFTQVVWKSSTEVGCGIKTCGGVWGDYVICSYDPAGNYANQYENNVEPLA